MGQKRRIPHWRFSNNSEPRLQQEQFRPFKKVALVKQGFVKRKKQGSQQNLLQYGDSDSKHGVQSEEIYDSDSLNMAVPEIKRWLISYKKEVKTSETGNTSETGGTGKTGDIGETGDTGNTGKTDKTGDTSDTGEIGETGVIGDTSDTVNTDETGNTNNG
ncbi:hypothetical protein C2G38_2199577 [Gigaspora rosea]|uniref:Collagen triple helix repeat protein n=1 Tax=Gigaspora rosea TaxID=44941 RepID=A0A397V0K8_9GLOM|nr:hypothetical protein C2G38_2199577 [Gigaspora rosea]